MDGVNGIVARLTELSSNAGLLEMLIKEEIQEMDDKTFWSHVCHNVIADTLEEVKVGTHLFQCAYRNRDVFNDRNNPHPYMIAKDPARPLRNVEPQPEIMVNIAQQARFSMTCPYGGMERCPLRNFRYATSEEEDAKRESMLVRETERMR